MVLMLPMRLRKKNEKDPNKKRVRHEAFTMIEILLVVGIIGALAAALLPRLMRRAAQADIGKTKTTMQSIKGAILEYKMDMGRIPLKREGGLDALIQKPTGRGAERWDGPYISGKDEVPLDAWNGEFIYNTGADIKNKNKFRYFELISLGANGEEGGEGDNADIVTGE